MLSPWDVYPHAVGGGRFVLASDFGVDASSAAQSTARFFSVCGLAAITLCAPLAMAWFLHRHRARLGQPQFRATYGFVYEGYDLDRGLHWWEMLIMVSQPPFACALLPLRLRVTLPPSLTAHGMFVAAGA